MSVTRRLVAASLGLSCLLGLGDVSGAEPVAGKASPASVPSKAPRVKITISKETTYITRPLRPDGYPDYVAALNEHFSRGVTPENNAAVLLFQAFGPGEIDEAVRERFFQMLGMPPLSAKGKYCVSLDEYANRAPDKFPAPTPPPEPDEARPPQDIAWAQHDTATSRPWSSEEFPALAGWLRENERTLKLVVEAARRPRCYVPLVCGSTQEMLIPTILPAMMTVREAVRELRCRAMLALKAGRVESAWQDLQACHRLARLAGQGPTLVDHLVGLSMDWIAAEGDVILIHYGDLTAEQVKKFAEDLRKLPAMPSLGEKMNLSERYVYLDCVSLIAREGPTLLRVLADFDKDFVEPKWLAQLAWDTQIDWDEPLRMGNRFYDRIASALAKPAGLQRKAVFDALDVERRDAAARATNPKNIAMALLSPTAAGQQMGWILLAQMTPACSALARADDHALTFNAMVDVAFSLAAYRAENGGYPTDLAALCPKYLAKVPGDLLGDGPVRYRREAQGYVLYSVGFNGKDDGGHNSQEEVDPDTPPEKVDPTIPQDSDDIVIRFPPQSATKK